MDGQMNENQLTIVKEYQFDKPVIQKIDCIIDDCIRDCYNKKFHTFDQIFEYDIKLNNITKNETVNLAISDKGVVCMNWIKN